MQSADFDIHDLIPHRPPMVMIDKLNHTSEISATGEIRILESNLFCENGYFLETGMIEFIAQTAAAFTGYKNKSNEKPVSEGYIGAIKNLVIHDLPPVGTVIRSIITIENEIIGYTIITGRVFLEQKLMAECEMRILVRGTGDEGQETR
jgi:predicted hotdog family 3-hydroxylacyl-ACP dehydratase